jgi:hypothetical protein
LITIHLATSGFGGKSVDENIYLATTPAYRQAGLVSVDRKDFKNRSSHIGSLATRWVNEKNIYLFTLEYYNSKSLVNPGT